LLSLI
jgi:hypothetical protein